MLESVLAKVYADHEGKFSEATVVVDVPLGAPDEVVRYEAESALRRREPPPFQGRPICRVLLCSVERRQNGSIIAPGGINPGAPPPRMH